jgi:hypothetical protein
VDEGVAAHLASLVDAIYRGLGRHCAEVGDDAYLVRLYETARAFGDLSVAWRGTLSGPAPEPFAPVLTTLARAFAEDESGALALYAVAAIIAPRFLVSLRDARERVGDDPLVTSLLDETSGVTVRQLRELSSLPTHDEGDDAAWRSRARALADELDAAGWSDSFGVSARLPPPV